MKKIYKLFTILMVIISVSACKSTEIGLAKNNKMQKNPGVKYAHKEVVKPEVNEPIKVETTIEIAENTEVILESREDIIPNNSTQDAEIITQSNENYLTTHNTVAKNHQIVKNDIQSQELNNSEKQFKKQIVKAQLKAAKKTQSNNNDIDPLLLYLLAFIFPPIAVGLATDWNTNDVVVNIILTLLCGIPGIIHAIIIVSKNV